MKKITAALIIAVSVFASSCSRNLNTPVPITTSIVQETATPAQLLDLPTPEFTPTLNNVADEYDLFLVTLGE